MIQVDASEHSRESHPPTRPGPVHRRVSLPALQPAPRHRPLPHTPPRLPDPVVCEGLACADLYDDQGNVKRSVYERLASRRTTPEKRREIVLALIECHPEGKLLLPRLADGTRANLYGIDLSREALLARYSRRIAANPVWWHPEHQVAKMVEADLRGAILNRATLSGVLMWSACLKGARLVGARLSTTQLGGADLRDASLADADLRWAHLSGARLRGAELRADLRGAYLQRADLRGADMRDASLQGAQLTGADLRRADLRGADLSGASLSRAKLQGVDLTLVRGLSLVHLAQAHLERAVVEPEQVAAGIGEEFIARHGWPSRRPASARFADAANAYMVLKQGFHSLGQYRAAGWAYRKERRMARLAAWHQFREAWRERRFAGRSLGRYLADSAAQFICDYGESPWRIIGWLAAVALIFAFVYWFYGGAMSERTGNPTYSLADVLLFSLAAMGFSTPAGLHASDTSIALLTYMQAFLGVGLTGLLGFVVGNRMRRS